MCYPFLGNETTTSAMNNLFRRIIFPQESKIMRVSLLLGRKTISISLSFCSADLASI